MQCLATSTIGQTIIKTGTFVYKGWNYGYNEITIKPDNKFNYTISTDYGLSVTYQGDWRQKKDTIFIDYDMNKTVYNTPWVDSIGLIKVSSLKYLYHKDRLYELTENNSIKDYKFYMKRKKQIWHNRVTRPSG